MKKAIILSIIGATSLAVCAEPVDPDSTGFSFTDVKIVKTTPVKDQNRSGTCWAFAATSFMEDEILRKTGRELDLSEMYTVRHCYLDKADRFIRMQGQTNFAAGGGIPDLPYVWVTYGVVPEEAYPGLNYGEKKHDHSELQAILDGYVKGVNSSKKKSTAWHKGFESILDAYLGEEPASFTFEGKKYTPASFAASLPLDMDDYVAITSYTHHPFYSPFVLEIPDNWMWKPYQNVPMEEMKAIVDNAIDNGYSVMWAADVSEGGFKWYKGYAVMPVEKDEASMEGTELSRWVKLSDKDRENERFDIKGPVDEIEVTQELRQQMFDNQETTDDHGMVIIGIATDQNDTPYYKVKNSWDTNQLYGGFFYVSVPYFLAKTTGIMVNKEAIPSQIAKKMGVKK